MLPFYDKFIVELVPWLLHEIFGLRLESTKSENQQEVFKVFLLPSGTMEKCLTHRLWENNDWMSAKLQTKYYF